MCGIIGYLGWRDAKQITLEGLEYLEYRGYDSAGMALLANGNLNVYRAVGGVKNLKQTLPVSDTYNLAIGHTRWATHGIVSVNNAHPHMDHSKRIAIVHNGTIENVSVLRSQLISHGYTFRSETDTEVLAYLLGKEHETTDSLLESFKKTLSVIRGDGTIVACCINKPELLVAARIGNAGGLVIGLAEGEAFVSSDSYFIAKYGIISIIRGKELDPSSRHHRMGSR